MWVLMKGALPLDKIKYNYLSNDQISLIKINSIWNEAIKIEIINR